MEDFDEIVFRNRKLDPIGEKIYENLKKIYRNAELERQSATAGRDVSRLLSIQNEAIYAAVALLFDN